MKFNSDKEQWLCNFLWGGGGGGKQGALLSMWMQSFLSSVIQAMHWFLWILCYNNNNGLLTVYPPSGSSPVKNYNIYIKEKL